MGNNFNWGDGDDINWGDEAAPARGKVLLFVNREPDMPPYLTFTTNITSELPVVLEELSGRLSPIEKNNCRIYVYEDDAWEVKGRFSQALKDDSPVSWVMTETDNNLMVLNLLVVGIFFFDIVHIYNLNNLQDDLVDEHMNLKPGSGSGPAASSSAGSKSERPAASSSAGSQSEKPMQQMLIDIFKTPRHLILHERVSSLRHTYSKYLAIRKMIKDVQIMEKEGTWTYPKPTVQDIAEVFMSRSGYFNRPRVLFPRVEVELPEMLQWLEGGEDAPAQKDVWGDKEPSFKNLKEILDSQTPGKKKKVTRERKKRPSKSEVVVKGKGKEKAKAKKAGESSKGKASSKKSHHDD